MKYALNLSNDGRILSVTFEQYACVNSVIVEELPESAASDYRYVNGEFIYDPLISDKRELATKRIDELKQLLTDTDYNIIKIVEGAATLDEMADIISKRSKWREEINELEKDLA